MLFLSQIHPYIKRHNKHAHKQGDTLYTGVYRDNTHAHTETWNTLLQIGDMVHRHRQKKKDTEAHKQGDIIYTGIYRDIEHTCTNKRHGTQAQTRDMVHRHRQETWHTNKET